MVKNLASLGLVSTTNLEPLLDKLYDCGMNELVDDTSSVLLGEHKIFLDGDWVGMCQDSESFVEQLRNMRRSNEVPHQVKCHIHLNLVDPIDADRIVTRTFLCPFVLYPQKSFSCMISNCSICRHMHSTSL